MRFITPIVTLVLLIVGTAGAERLWTEGALATGLSADTPITFGAFSTLAEKTAPAVVSIETEAARAEHRIHPFFGDLGRGAGIQRGAGSGVIIRADGYVLTNNHVIEGARVITVHMKGGKQHAAQLVGRDPATDIALLKVEGVTDLPVAPFGDSDVLKIGSWVVAIGNPMGLSHTVTAGIVSAKGRRDVRPDGRLRYPDFIQTDASINPGNSGGPLFNLKGEIVGINTAINARAQGIGFAIPINMIKTVLPQLADKGRVARSWIGVQIGEVTPALASSLGMKAPRGALVAGVVPGGPAADAGLSEEDVILSFDGKPIRRHDDLPWLASTAGIGRSVPVELMRAGRTRTLQIRLGRMPGEDQRPARLERRTKEKAGARTTALGMRLGEVDRQLRARLNVNGGVVVLGVDAGSAAAENGVRRGDVILRCNGQVASSARSLAEALNGVEEGKMIRLLVQRDESRAFLAFTR